MVKDGGEKFRKFQKCFRDELGQGDVEMEEKTHLVLQQEIKVEEETKEEREVEEENNVEAMLLLR